MRRWTGSYSIFYAVIIITPPYNYPLFTPLSIGWTSVFVILLIVLSANVVKIHTLVMIMNNIVLLHLHTLFNFGIMVGVYVINHDTK